jgi:hypothetical protein
VNGTNAARPKTGRPLQKQPVQRRHGFVEPSSSRVFWGRRGQTSIQTDPLGKNLSSRHSPREDVNGSASRMCACGRVNYLGVRRPWGTIDKPTWWITSPVSRLTRRWSQLICDPRNAFSFTVEKIRGLCINTYTFAPR